MKLDVKEIAKRLFDISEEKPSTSGGSHKIEIDCENNREQTPDILPNLENGLASFIDHTILKPDAIESEVIQLCKEANQYGFASVCVNPVNVPIVKANLQGPLVCSVIGFPLGASTTAVKVLETERAIDDGADEIDMVINVGMLKDKKYKAVLDDIRWVVEACQEQGKLLKVIIETCLLTDEEKVIACLLAKKAGAEYVKTSTGFSSGGATAEDIKLMREVVGPKMGVKASGGVRTKEDAMAMINAGASRIGASKSIAIIGE